MPEQACQGTPFKSVALKDTLGRNLEWFGGGGSSRIGSFVRESFMGVLKLREDSRT